MDMGNNDLVTVVYTNEKLNKVFDDCHLLLTDQFAIVTISNEHGIVRTIININEIASIKCTKLK